jgi:hypothetical protein
MNLHVITPSDLLRFQIEHYSEMLEKPRSFKHKIFLRKQLKQLQNGTNNNAANIMDTDNGVACASNFRGLGGHQMYKGIKEKLERI